VKKSKEIKYVYRNKSHMYDKILCKKTIYIEIQMKHIDGKEFMKIQSYHVGGKKNICMAKNYQ
jgi:hypothetical protein